MVNVTMSGTYEGRPLEVLGKLIEERKRILGESAADAVAATAIDVLGSLKALTKVSPKKARPREQRVDRDYDKAPYVTKKDDPGFYGTHLLRRWKYTRLPGTPDEWTRIRYAWTRRTRGKTGRMHGGSAAEEHRQIKKYLQWIPNSGLARKVLGVAQNEISTRPSRIKEIEWQEYARGNRRAVPKKYAILMWGGAPRNSAGIGDVWLSVRDTLGYAQQALRHGQSDVELSIQKAANKIAGRLCKVAEAKLGERIETPFPEVKRRRVA